MTTMKPTHRPIAGTYHDQLIGARRSETVRRMARPDFELGQLTPRDGAHVLAVHVPTDLRYLEGHFPGDPIVPGIAQLALAERAARTAHEDLGPTRGVKRLKFSARIDPGDDLEIELSRTDDKVRFVIRREETECSRGTIVF
jgi:3-hydroxymyristoyl/3-hydroxydecanoyl-(acyl carrier protein) dehydratase